MRKYKRKVSVIMGIHNQWDKNALFDAVDSILQQSLQDFEFIIYDDGSHEEVGKWIRELALLDERIVAIGKNKNHGLAFSLNQCIKQSTGMYIARMDADDICMPYRLEKQIDFLEHHPEYMWCGCNAILFDEDGVYGERKMPEIPSKDDYLKYSPFIHPSVMFRADLFECMGEYCVSKETLRCEDYELFMRFHQAGYRGYNLQENLFQYRENKASFKRRKFTARVNEAKIRYKNFKAMKLLLPKGWMYVLRPIIAGFVPQEILLCLKKSEAKEIQYENRTKRAKNGAIQTNIARETNL